MAEDESSGMYARISRVGKRACVPVGRCASLCRCMRARTREHAHVCICVCAQVHRYLHVGQDSTGYKDSEQRVST